MNATWFLLSSSFSNAQVSDSTPVKERCVEISVSGDESKVLRAIGDLVAAKKIQTFMVKGVGREGGFWACIVPFGDYLFCNLVCAGEVRSVMLFLSSQRLKRY